MDEVSQLFASIVLPDDFAADVFKSLIGSFVGAGLAFLFALRKDRLSRLQAQKAAGNSAVTTLARMTGDFFQVRDEIAAGRAEVLAKQPHSPTWMLVKPFPLNYSENLRFNIDSLTFIFEDEQGPEVFEKLLNVEIKYHNFFYYLREHRKVSEEVQDLLSSSVPYEREEMPLGELKKVIGLAKLARMESLVKVILEHVDRSEKIYTEAIDAFPPLLKKIFGDKGVVKIIPPNASGK